MVKKSDNVNDFSFITDEVPEELPNASRQVYPYDHYNMRLDIFNRIMGCCTLIMGL